ncbi:STAS domain-containing protein [Puniceibacterium sp. IMCC21224]|uniref:STAS domain-containing protein n=1 Tax=Puniceibacterium sp. IMCC21224 TaxID=1618204 RepID=UPI00064E0CA6|nr:STAS domain-containing protein [Puniceibacterium sp. IMCC21224]KMK68724.1 anti-anti-sigma factor [Puniceibacterium sp. IMCC21224]
MDLISSRINETQVVTVNGSRIDASVAIQFKDRMREITAESDGRIVLDLHKVAFIDSSGLGAIVAAMKQLSNKQKLDLAGLTPTVDKVFRLTRMDTIFAIHADAISATDHRAV